MSNDPVDTDLDLDLDEDADAEATADAETVADAETKVREVSKAASEVEDAKRTPRKKRHGIQTLESPTMPHGARIRRKVHQIARGVEQRVEARDTRPSRGALLGLRILLQVFRQWSRDRCPQAAASLSFQAILSMVPLTAVVLVVLRTTGSLNEQSSFVEFVANEYLPVSRQEISGQMLKWSENVNFQSLGLIGLLTTIVLAFILVNNLERVINYIWRSERRRSTAQKFVVFYAAATIGPLLVGTSLFQASQLGLTDGAIGSLTSFVIVFVTLFLANYFLPSCPVRARSAALGAVTTAVLFELSRVLFDVYVTNFALDKFSGIYGAMAILPIWLLWIYYSWLTLLLGVEVAHATQNIHVLQRVDRRGTSSMENDLIHRVNAVVAARVMVAIAEAYIRGEKMLSRRALEERFDVSDDVVDRITTRLKEQDLVIEVYGDRHGYMPARPPSEIALGEVLNAFRGDDVIVSSRDGGSKLDSVLEDIRAITVERTANLYLDDLVTK